MEVVHPFTRAVYTRVDPHTVRVQHGGKDGLFAWNGRWIEGELRQADPNMCIYVAGGYRGDPMADDRPTGAKEARP